MPVPIRPALLSAIVLIAPLAFAQPNDSCSTPIDLGSGSSVTAWDNSSATDDGPPLLGLATGAPCATWTPSNGIINGDLWYTWTPAAGEHVATFSMCYPILPIVTNELLDSRIVIYDSTNCLTLSTADVIACDDDSCVDPDNEIQAVVTTVVTPGTTYLIQVGSRSLIQSGVSTLTISAQAPPVENLACSIGPGTDDYSISFDYPAGASAGDSVEIYTNEVGAPSPLTTLAFPLNTHAATLLPGNAGNPTVLDLDVRYVTASLSSPDERCQLLLNQGAGDECATAGFIGTGSTTVNWNHNLGTNSPEPVPSSCPSDGHFAPFYNDDLWYRWTAATDQTRFIYTNPTGEPAFAVYNGCAAAAAGVALDCIIFGNALEFTLATVPGNDYLIRVCDLGGVTTNGLLQIISEQGPVTNLSCTTAGSNYTLTWDPPGNASLGDVMTIRTDEPGSPIIIGTVNYPGNMFSGTLLPANQGMSLGVTFEVIYGSQSHGFSDPASCGVTFQPLPGDECTSATDIGTGDTVFNFNSVLAGDSPDPIPAVCASGGGGAMAYESDLWFQWTATHPTTAINVFTQGWSSVIAIYDDCGAAGSGNALDCFNPGQSNTMSVTTVVGNVYYIRIGADFGMPGSGVLTITGHNVPSNDDCAAATDLGGGNHTINLSTLGATTSAEPPPAGPCPSAPFFIPTAFPQDIWYKWTSGGGSAFISIEGTTDLGDPVLAVYDSCASALGGVAVDCQDRGNPSVIEMLTTAGSELWIRVSHENSTAGLGQLIIAQFAIPTNDDCATAQVLGGGDQLELFSTTGSTASADPVPTGPCASSTAIPGAFPADIWYEWTSSGSLTSFSVEGLAGMNDPVVAVYEHCADAGIGVALDCADHTDPSVVRVPTTAGQTYLVRLSHESSSPGVGRLLINEIQPAAHDECVAATNLGTGSQLLTVDLRGATGSPEPTPTAASCASDQTVASDYDPDVWYRWTASSNSATFSFIRANLDPVNDPVFAIYDSCSDATVGDFVDCQDNQPIFNEITIALTPGNDYLIRVAEDFGIGGGLGTLMISEFQSVLNFTCSNPSGSDYELTWTNPPTGGPGDVIEITSTEPGIFNPAFSIPWPGTSTMISSLLPGNQLSPSLFVTYTARYVTPLVTPTMGEECSILFNPAPGDLCSVATNIGSGDMVVNYDNNLAVTGPDPVPSSCPSGGQSASAYDQDLWFEWMADHDQTRFEAELTSGSVQLAVYVSCTAAANANALDCVAFGLSAEISLPTVPGNVYYIRVAHSGFQPPSPGVLTIEAVQTPVSGLICNPTAGDSTTVSWTNPASALPGDTIVVTTNEPGVANPVATLAVPMNSVSYTLSPAHQGMAIGVDFDVTIIGTIGTSDTVSCRALFNALLHDECAGALVLSGSTPIEMTVDLNTATASVDPDPACNIATDFNEDLFFEWTATVTDAEISFLSATTSDPVIAVYETCFDVSSGNALECNDGGPGEARVVVTLQVGSTYIIRVANDDSTALGAGQLRIDAQCPPLTDFAVDFDCTSQTVSMSWTEEGFYTGLVLTANGVPLASQPLPAGAGAQNGHLDASPILDTNVTYELTATCANGGIATVSATVGTAVTAASALIVSLEGGGLVDSTTALEEALAFHGTPHVTISSQNHPCIATLVMNSSSIWVVEGTFPTNTTITPAFGTLLHQAALNGQGVYLEGGDHWASATPSAFDLVDGVATPVADGDDAATTLQGFDAPTSTLSIGTALGGPVGYTQDRIGNDSIDELVVATPAQDTDITSSEIVFRNVPDFTPIVAAETDFVSQVVVETTAASSVISSSVEFGGIGDAATREALMAEYISLFLGTGPHEWSRGDCNNDGAKNIADPIRLLNFLFPPALPPTALDCESACDANDDGGLNIADAVTMLNVLFPIGPPIGWLAPDVCGTEPTPDMLTCLGYTACP